MTTRVINIKSLPLGGFPRDENDVYIGRNMMYTKYKLAQSKWYNPYLVDKYNKDGTIKTKRDGSNLDVIRKYGAYLSTQKHLIASLYELTDKVLGCWCKPLPCHGDILVMYVEHMEKWTDMSKEEMAKRVRELLEESELRRII
jgi:hypothetical protein